MIDVCFGFSLFCFKEIVQGLLLYSSQYLALPKTDQSNKIHGQHCKYLYCVFYTYRCIFEFEIKSWTCLIPKFEFIIKYIFSSFSLPHVPLDAINRSLFNWLKNKLNDFHNFLYKRLDMTGFVVTEIIFNYHASRELNSHFTQVKRNQNTNEVKIFWYIMNFNFKKKHTIKIKIKKLKKNKKIMNFVSLLVKRSLG